MNNKQIQIDKSKKDMWSKGMRRKDREVTNINEIKKILLQCKTCHVAMVEDGMPYVVPLSYGYRILNDNLLELYV